MNSSDTDRVEDPNGLLKQQDHMRDMERTRMEILRIDRPYPSVARVTGCIAPHDPAGWSVPNAAVRIEVDHPAGASPITRIYTIRQFDPATSRVEIDFVLHADDSPSMRWLGSAAVGTDVWMTGPRAHFVPPFTPGKRAALFADDTAIPAVHAILRAWPEGVEGAIWIDTVDPEAFEALPHVPGVERHCLLRSREVPAGISRSLFAAARSALSDPLAWTVWAAGERGEMRDFRSHFRAQGIAREALQILGYWKLGVSGSELDRARLAAYSAARARGLSLEEMMDSDEAD